MASIGDVFLRVLADFADFEADVVRKADAAGDKAGKSMSQRLGQGLKANAGKVFGATMALGFGIATKGLLELQNVTAEFAAETGASADEADRAGKAINNMAGRNLQPMGEIGKALAKVHTDLGLTGDEAEKVTQTFLTFGRATKQNAAAAVKAFDDILDAWGLTAADAAGVMDKLVVSHQKYGGSIEANQAALAALAPALQAANLKVDDGIALLNLFEASGVDSAVAVTGMTKALTKVESPEQLKELIADIIATEDPFLRAQKAADLFGAKAGAKLANALKPGSGGLDAFTVSTDEAAGATQRAADVLDSTWGARFQQMIKAAGSAITGFGSNFGPALTGMASLASLGGGKLLGPLTGALRGAWTKVAAASAVRRAIALASGKAATIYLAGLIAGDAIGGALSKAWLATGGRLLAAAGVTGAASGTAFAAAAAAAIVAAPLAVLAVAIKIQGDIDAQGSALKDQATDWVKRASDEELANAIAGVREQLDGMVFNTFDSKNKVVAVLNELIAEQNRRVPQVVAASTEVGRAIPTGVAAGIEGGAASVGVAASAALIGQVLSASDPLKAKATSIGRSIMTSIATAILDTQGEVGAAMLALENQIDTERTPAQQAAYDIGVLVSGSVADGIKDKREGVRAQAANVRLIAEAELRQFIASGGRIGKKAMAELIAAEKSKDPDVRAQAKRTRAIIESNVKPNTRPAGVQAGKGVVTGLNSQRGPVGTAATNLGRKIARNILGGILYQGGGRAAKDDVYIPRVHGGPVEAGQPYVVGERRPELFVPKVDGMILPKVPSAASEPSGVTGGSGNTYNVNLLDRMQVRSVRDIGSGLRMLGEQGHFGGKR